jgi:spermidine synthase
MKFLARWRVRKPAEDEQTPYISERYGVRTLHIGSDTVQSAMRLARPIDLELSYTRSMMACLLFTSAPGEVLTIGLGGGSVAKFVYHRLLQARVTAVEVNSEVVAIARQFFHVPANEPRFQVVIADGAEYVQRNDVSADILIVDGYDADAHAEELASRDFYVACRERLKDAGVLVVNLWGGDKSFTTLLQRIEEAFAGAVLCLPAERPGNVIVFGFRNEPGPLEWTALTARAASLESELGLEFARFAEGLKKMNRHDQRHLFTRGVRAAKAARGFS